MAQQTDKQLQQAKFLAEIMHGDEKDGLYEPTVSKMERVQTAVQWLADKLNKEEMIIYHGLFDMWIKQAKQMEKEQIIKAYKEARQIGCKCYDDLDDKNAEPYYNETYNK